MRHRLGSACCLLLCVLVAGRGAAEKTPAFTWTGPWEKTELVGCYHSYIKLEDGRIACFENGNGLRLDVSFTREPGNLFTWTPYARLMAWEAIFDLPDPTDPKKPAANRMMTRPTVVRLPGGDYLGLGAICRDYPPVDGRIYMASYTGSAESVNMMKEALLAGREAPKSAIWEYQGKVKGPVGEYQDKMQINNSIHTDVGNLIFLPDGPAKPDHERPPHNRFLLFANYLGSPDPMNDWLSTVLCYSADGREWFFAKDADGVVRNLTPFRGEKRDHLWPFVFRHAADEWWMWQSDDWQEEEGKDAPLGVHEISLYYSPDGLNWRRLRTDIACKDFPGTNGKPLGLKNMSIYYDAETGQIHGMLSVRNEKEGESMWRKYHNVATVTWK